MARVFVSHRGADSAEAERLAQDLGSAGHDVWLDQWEIMIGDSIVGKINDGLESCEYLILCYSTHGVSSSWITREWYSSLARQMENKGIRIIPARLTGGEPPGILADIKYADLTKNWSQGIAELLSSLR